MSISTGKLGKGVLFRMASLAAPTAFVTQANLVSFNLTGESASEIESTLLDSEDAYRDFIQGFKDPGQAQLTLHFDPALATQNGAGGIRAKYDSGEKFPWQVDFTPVGMDFHMSGLGFIMSPGDLAVNIDNIMTVEPVLRRVGKTTIADAA